MFFIWYSELSYKANLLLLSLGRDDHPSYAWILFCDEEDSGALLKLDN